MKNQNRSVLIKVKELPPSPAFRAWIKKYIPKGVKILYTTDKAKD